MKKKLLFSIIGGIIVLMVGLAFFIQFQISKIKEAEEKPEIEESQSLEEIVGIIMEAMRKEDLSVCDKLKSKERKRQCLDFVLGSKALTERNIKLCQEIENENRRRTCEDDVILVQAIDAKDPILCDKIKDKFKMELCKKKIPSLK
ncbi:MAG: hypothetical protein QME61_02870 [Patescibacteria group bacterium]|nr:hypothetical protein [Patescibacteria group bacterium]